MKNSLVCLLAVCLASPAAAQNGERPSGGALTLKDCIERGLERNFSIKMIKNRQQVSANNATPANAGLLPTAEIAASYGGDFHSTSTTERATGLKTTDRNVYDGTLDVGVDLNWTLFDGFSVWTNYKQLKLMKEQGELDTRITIENYVASLVQEYYNFIQQSVRLKNYHKNMELSRERFRNAEINYGIGSSSQIDYLQAMVDFNADSTQYMKQLEYVNTSRIRMNELLNSGDVSRAILLSDTTIDVNSGLRYEELWRSTLATNASLLMAHTNTEIARADYKKVMSRDYPYVRLNVGYGYTMNRYEISATKRRDDWGLNAGVTVGFNLFDGKRRMQKRNAELDIKYAELERENLRLSLRSDLNDYWQAYKNNLQIVQKAREILNDAERYYELAYLSYQKGMMSGFEVREVQNSLLDAEERILTAEYDTKMCEVSLMLLSGKVLDYLEGGE